MNNTKRHLVRALLAVCLLATASPALAIYSHYGTFRGANDFAVTKFFQGSQEARWLFKGQDAIATFVFDPTNWEFEETLKADGSVVFVFSKSNGSIFNIAYWRYNSQGVLTNIAAFNSYTSHVDVEYIVDVQDRTIVVFVDANNHYAWYLNADGTLRAQYIWGDDAIAAGGWAVSEALTPPPPFEPWQGIQGDLISANFYMHYIRLVGGGFFDMLAYYTFDYNGNWIGVRAYTS